MTRLDCVMYGAPYVVGSSNVWATRPVVRSDAGHQVRSLPRLSEILTGMFEFISSLPRLERGDQEQ